MSAAVQTAVVALVVAVAAGYVLRRVATTLLRARRARATAAAGCGSSCGCHESGPARPSR